MGTSLSGYGKIEKIESIFTEESADHAATLVFPKQTDIEKLASLNDSAAIQSYLVVRTYLEDFLDYDIENGNIEE